MINESRDSVGEIFSPSITKFIVREQQNSITKVYGYYKLGQTYVKNWSSFILLQIRATLLQIGLASLSQIGASVVTN